MIEALAVGELDSNEEIFKSLKVSNAGGIRLSLQGQNSSESRYHDLDARFSWNW